MSLKPAFLSQSQNCIELGSPFMGQLMAVIAEHIDTKHPSWFSTFTQLNGDLGPNGKSIPLRLAGSLHAMVLLSKSDKLLSVYPPNTVSNSQLWGVIEAEMHRLGKPLSQWMQHYPQTNEVRRSSALIATAHMLNEKYQYNMMLSELGASAGLNLNWDKYCLDISGHKYGPQGIVNLRPDWYGPRPTNSEPIISNRSGVDINPIDPQSKHGLLSLKAYTWPDQLDRLERLNNAAALQNTTISNQDTVTWLQSRLSSQKTKCCHFIYHTIAWQYFSPETQIKCENIIESQGQVATEHTPLAWLSYEADNTVNKKGALLRLRLWPDNLDIILGRACFHGQWIEWNEASLIQK